MTAELHPVVARIDVSDAYDGTNGADLVALFAPDLQLDSDNGLQLGVSHPLAGVYVLELGDRLMAVAGGFGGNLPAAMLTPGYRAIPEAFGASVGGPVSVPASLLGQTAAYNVTIDPPMPHTDYVPVPRLQGPPGVLGGHAVTAVAVVDENTVSVTVASAAASLAGATIHVVAFARV